MSIVVVDGEVVRRLTTVGVQGPPGLDGVLTEDNTDIQLASVGDVMVYNDERWVATKITMDLG